MKNSELFLSEDEIDQLTGIGRGETIFGRKLTKHQRQVEFLRKRGIPFIENARGKAMVTRAAIEGHTTQVAEAPKRAWQPRVA